MRHRIHLARGVVFLLALGMSIAAAELVLRVAVAPVGAVQPVHDVLFLQPNAEVGWTLAPDFSFVWSGRNPYCVEFTVPVQTNAIGFRDRAWSAAASPETIRIAVIGDSFVEAIQVQAEETATRQLERRLSARFPGQRFETMNFGVSNYSVGQFLMAYDAFVRPFKPDYVVVLAAYLDFNRTTQRALSSVLQDFYALEIRPSFTLDSSGNLVTAPPRQHEAYAKRVAELIETEYGPDRSRPVRGLPSPLHLSTWLLRTGVSTASRMQHWRPSWGEPEFTDVELNHRILGALHQKVRDDGGVFVFADAFEYLEPYGNPRGSGRLAARNQRFVESAGARYLNVSTAMAQVPSQRRFSCDMHFSAAEHTQLAETLTDWFSQELAAAPAMTGRGEDDEQGRGAADALRRR
jgi:hypothetical protein